MKTDLATVYRLIQMGFHLEGVDSYGSIEALPQSGNKPTLGAIPFEPAVTFEAGAREVLQAGMLLKAPWAVGFLDGDNCKLVQRALRLLDNMPFGNCTLVLRMRKPTELVGRLIDVACGPTDTVRWWEPEIGHDLKVEYKLRTGPDPDVVRGMVYQYYEQCSVTGSLISSAAESVRGARGKSVLVVRSGRHAGGPMIAVHGHTRFGPASLTVAGSYAHCVRDLESHPTYDPSGGKWNEITSQLALFTSKLDFSPAWLTLQMEDALKQIDLLTGDSPPTPATEFGL